MIRLVQDRELQLFDGRRLLRADRYDDLKTSGEDMTGLERIHPDFHIIATAGLPDGKKKWLTPELLNLFFFHTLPPITEEEELSIIKAYCRKGVPSDMSMIIASARSLREAKDESKKSLASSLSTRQLIRIAKRLETFGGDAFDEVSRACLSRLNFLFNLKSTSNQELQTI